MGSMLSLLDVLPRHERVAIGSQEIAVYGVSGGDIGRILARFPNMFEQMAATSTSPASMHQGLLGALLAASQRNGNSESLLGNDEVEATARALSVSDQMTMLLAMGRCTFPEGVGPFLERLASLSSQTNEAMEVVVQVASRAQAMASPRTPKPSASPSTPTSGT